MPLLPGDERHRGHDEPVFEDAEAMPLGEFCEGFCAELTFGVCRDHAASVRVGAERPEDDPRDKATLARAMSGGRRILNDVLPSLSALEPVAHGGQDFSLPLVGPGEVCERALATGEGNLSELQRIIRALRRAPH